MNTCLTLRCTLLGTIGTVMLTMLLLLKFLALKLLILKYLGLQGMLLMLLMVMWLLPILKFLVLKFPVLKLLMMKFLVLMVTVRRMIDLPKQKKIVLQLWCYSGLESATSRLDVPKVFQELGYIDPKKARLRLPYQSVPPNIQPQAVAATKPKPKPKPVARQLSMNAFLAQK